jgi:hypothetical protein
MAVGMAHDDLEARRMLEEAVEDGGAPILTLTVLDDLVVRPA